MTSPVLEALVDGSGDFPGIAIYDAAKVLAELAANFRAEARKAGTVLKAPFGRRDPSQIEALVIHKSGANGPPGLDGAIAMTRFVVVHRGWSGPPYTLWLPREPSKTNDGRLVVYRCQRDDMRSWHTGGRMNRIGIAIGVQGNYDGEWDLLSNGLPKIEREPTEEQWRALPLLVDWCLSTYPKIVAGREGPDDDWGLTGHWEHGKPICPGDALRRWVMQRRGEVASLAPEIPLDLPPARPSEIDPYRFTPKDYQAALRLVGCNPGPIDGKPGVLTRAALEKFQSRVGLTVDGWYGPKTARALLESLRSLNLADRRTFADHRSNLERG